MKRIMLTLFICCSCFVYAQRSNVDSLVSTLDFTGEHDPYILADTLTTAFKTDSEKVRAIYYWIGHNIAYDCHNAHLLKSNYNYNELNDEQDARTLAKRKGICDDYSKLFFSMCKEAGIQCVIIDGYGTSDLNDALSLQGEDKSGLHHAWNAVKINGTWRLVDPTWGSGYCDKGMTKFTRSFNYTWFFANSKDFLVSHLPDDSQWELVDTPLDLKGWIQFVKKSYGVN